MSIEGMLAETPASLRDPQLEQKAALLSEKVRILEEGLGRFVGRERAKAKEESERCAPRRNRSPESASGDRPRAGRSPPALPRCSCPHEPPRRRRG